MTVIVTPTSTGMPYPVKAGGWMTEPLDVEPGQPVTMIAQDRDGTELFRVDLSDARPAFGPDWVGYAPLDE